MVHVEPVCKMAYLRFYFRRYFLITS